MNHTEEHKNNISLGLKKAYKENRRNPIMTKEVKEKISNSLKELWKNKEYKDNIIFNRIGRISHRKGLSLEEEYGKEKALIIKQANKIKHIGSKYSLGKHHTKEAKRKISLIVKDWASKHNNHYKDMALKSRSSLKQKHSSIEIKMENLLLEKNINFIKEKNICGFYVDFYLPEYRIIIECDGDYWHNYPFGTIKDKRENAILESEGYLVLRFWENEINQNITKCFEKIGIAINVEAD